MLEIAAQAGRPAYSPLDTGFATARERRLDVLADLVETHVDTDRLWRLIERGPPAGLPFVPPGAPR